MSDPTLYLYTSLTAGSSHIVTATARLETILKANKLPFRVVDVATDDAARKLWGRRSKGKTLPGLVKFSQIVGDLEDIEDWNEHGELRFEIDGIEDYGDNLPATSYPVEPTPAAQSQPTTETATQPKQSTIKIQAPPAKEETKDDSIATALRQAGEEAASKAKDNKTQQLKQSQPQTQTQPEPKSTTSTSKEPSASDPKPEPQPEKGDNDKKQETQEEPTDTVCRRKSSAPVDFSESGIDNESNDNSTTQGTATTPRRPRLVPELAAVSTADFRSENAIALGLIQHHRGSIVSATSPEEQAKVAQDLRTSISGGRDESVLESLRDEKKAMAAAAGNGDTIDESVEDEEAPSVEEIEKGVREAKV